MVNIWFSCEHRHTRCTTALHIHRGVALAWWLGLASLLLFITTHALRFSAGNCRVDCPQIGPTTSRFFTLYAATTGGEELQLQWKLIC